MEILTTVATKIAGLTVEPIVRQVGYLLCHRNNLKELKDLANQLQETKERIDHKVEAERRNGREIEGDVLKWQESVIKTLEEAKQLWEDPHDANVWCFEWYFPNFMSRYQHSRKAKEMADTIVEMKGKGKFVEGVAYVPYLDITSNFPAIRRSDGLESRKSVKEDVMLSLKDPKANKIGVYGIGGVGKTTLVQEVAKQVKHDKLFDVVLMVTISQTNLERIQDEIAEQLDLCLEERTSSSGRANRLCERIKKEKTVLIILDDLREKIDLDKLGIPLDTWGKMNPEKVGVPLKDDYKGCKLLMTSRSQDILQKNDAQKNFSLQVLNDQESWSLFEAMVGDVVKDDNFRKIATQVAQRCVGLPVLIVTIAKSLKHNEDIYYWKDTLNNLKRVDNSRDMNETLFSALEFNFNRLEDEVKKVLLLCGVHGTSIFVSDLLKYAIGLGIFKCINTIEDARNRLYRIIIDLKASCLLVDDDARGEVIKMHDIVHEVAVSMASKYAFTKINAKLQDWPGKDILERCTHIILVRFCIQKLPERLDCPHLTFLYINSSDNRTLEIPNSFFEGMRNLEALDLTGMTIASLPTSLSSLTKLKTLCLDQCSLKDMTGIGALTNLEILSLIHSSVEEFPREIKKLTKLRMLDLSRSGIGTTLPNILCKLTKIEELYLGDATINWEVESSATQKRNASLAKLGDLTGLTTLEIQIREAWLLPKDIPFEKLERYKVVVGDNWEWSDNKETSRLLKVKLDTNIRWERGIKTLIKRVEDLYLNEISGISNVLFDLNGEGFPLLRHLHIQNNGEIRHIVNSMKRNQTHVLFPELETMILHNLNNLVKICYGSVMDNSFGKLKIVKVKSCDQLEYLFSVSMVKAFSQLVEIEVSECSSMKKIMSVESTDSGKTIDEKIESLPLRSLTLQRLPTIDYFCSHELTPSLGTMENLLRDNIPTPFFSAKVKFSNLETLKLSSVNLKKIWDDSSAPYLVHNLANLTVEDCNGLKYLFSSSMVGRLSNLKQIEISKCDTMEEIIAAEEINGVAVGEVLFPKLEAIIIKDMQNLKTIWHPILASNSLACLKTLKVKNCEKIERIFPEYMNGAFVTLETLKVKDCKSVQEIFQSGDNPDDKPQLKYITLLRLPQLNQVWSRDPQSSHCFKSLQVVRVEDCGHLEYLLPFSIAGHLPQLEAITIKNAEKMKEIVSKREGPIDKVVNFEFDQLSSIVLWNLHDLQGFYAGKHSLSCSSLKELDVWKCGKLKLFRAQGMSSQGRHYDDNLSVSMQQSLFTLEEVIDNLENLDLSNEDARMIFQSQVPRDQFRQLKFLRLLEFDAQATSPYWFLQNISNLERLVIQDMSFRTIFPAERPQDENGEIDIKTRLKKLTLYRLYELQHICKEGCQLDPVLEVLEYLNVDQCSSLKHLVPSSVTFNNLTCLEVQNCNGLIYLITSSTARSLVNLTTLKIIRCDLVEQIVEEAGGESICEIAFQSLQVLELESLPKLKMFCSSSICFLKLPVLEKLVIRQCPRMESFSASDTSTPLLREILTDEQDKKWFCEGDLNKTVNKMFQDKVAFRSAKHLELSEYPELKDLWSSHVQMGIFGSLTNLVVHKCDFLSDVLLPLNLLQALSNLEELKVSECDSLRAVFDLTSMNERGMSAKVIIHLKTIELSRLPELKRIWKINCQEEEEDNEGDIQHDEQPAIFRQVYLPKLETLTIEDMENLETIWHPVLTPNSMGNFETLKVKSCQTIEHIFPICMHGVFATLETLMVEDCNSVHEIFQLGAKDMCNGDDTTQLKNIKLLSLPKLKHIWSRDPQSGLRFKNLQVVSVENCEDLEYLFPFSIAMNLPLLEQIMIKQATRIKEIVSKREEPLDNPVKFVFKSLTSLVLWNLDDLEGFCAGNHILTCHSLKELDVFRCMKLKLFTTQRASGQGRPLLTLEEVIGNLEELTLSSDDVRIILQGQYSGEQFSKLRILFLTVFEDDQTTFPYWFLQNMTGLEQLNVEWSSFKEIFPEEVRLKIENKTRIKTLKLIQLHELQHICKEGCQLDPILEVLEYLYVDQCSSLKHLVPSSVIFNHLVYLEVQNCKELIYLITSSTAKSLVKLTTLKIRECDLVEQIVADGGGESSNEIEFISLEVLELESLPKLYFFGSSNCSLTLPLLEKLVIRECPKMKTFSTSGTSVPSLREILTDEQDEQWFCDGDLNSTVNKIFHDKLQVAFRGYERLQLSQYPELRELWYSYVQSGVFSNLKDLVVQKCDFLSKVLLPLNLLKALTYLEKLQVSECDSLEAVFDISNVNGNEVPVRETIQLKRITLSCLPELKHIWKQNYQETDCFRETTEEGCIQRGQPAYSSGQVVLPNLETIIIKEMQNLETVWHPILCPNSMGNFQTLEISKCGKIENIYPLYMQGAFTNLETLTVTECSSLKEIFQLNIKDEEHPTKLKNITLLRLPQLQQIWSRDSQSSLRLENLQIVRVECCGDLEYIFPFSMAMGLLQIEQITIKYAWKMKEIFSGKEGPLDCPPKFEFNRMTSLVLWSLPEFQGFFSKSHSLACPSLKILDVRSCSKWSLFKKQGAANEGEVIDSNLQSSTQRSPFPKQVICNLETLTLNYEHAMIVQGQFSEEQFHALKRLILSKFEDDQAIFPYFFLQNASSLKAMVVENSSFKEIFQHEGQNGIQTRIKRLTLNKLHELLDICKDGFQIDPVLELLEYLDVDNCSKLKLLLPSSVSFNQLTYLLVQNCNGLIYLITSSTASSLVKLTTLKIRACNSLEQVMPEENEESVNEIAFSSLQVLELECLPRFKIFSSVKCVLKLPLLTKLIVVQCPRMKSFSMSNTSAPKIQKILTGKQDGKWCWEGDLNRTVDKIFQDKVAFSSFNHLELSEYPELKELWYDQVGPKIFCNLKHLVVRKCTFLSDVLFSSNLLQLLYALEELEVAECDLLEVVFDVKALNDKEMESKEVSRLKKLTLSGLPNLKRIWNREAEEIISFRNLQIVKVDKCQHLKYLFSVSQCQDFGQLEELHVEYCGVEEIVSIEEGLLEELKFEFPRLISLNLVNLTELTNFCPKRYTLECPSLKILNVYRCEELPMFAFEDLISQPLREGDTELQIEQALFHIEKVSQNLEQLSLNGKDAMRILSGNYEKNLFQNIKVLGLQHFQETPIKFLNGLIQKFPSTTTVQVRRSSLETLFPSKEIDHCSVEIPSQIKNLWLFKLEQLEHIWNDDDSISHPLVGSLEYLSIIECSGIKILAPPSASFKNLTSLEVKDCNGLMYFMTSCTAKSLVNLTSLTVSNCGMLEEVVMTDEGESEEEITFESLKYLDLTCLSGLKSFCSGKHTFILESLVTLKVIECPKMQNFSSGVIIAPFLKLVEVENGKKHWKEGLNTTIQQLFIDKAIEGVEGDYIESSSIIQSSQTYQKSVGSSRALIFEKHVAESKAHEIVDSRKQEIQKVLNIPQTGADTRKICEIVETPLDQASQSTLSLTKVDAAIETEEMKETIQTLFAEVVTLTHTSVQETALGTQDETFERPLVKTSHQGTLSLSKVQDTEKLHSDIKNQETYKTSEKALVPVAQNVLSSSMVDNIAIDPSRSQALEAMTSSIQDGALQNQETYENSVERPFVQSAKIALSTTTVYDADTGNKELHETIQRLLVQNVEDMLISASSVQNIATETHLSIDKPFFQPTQSAWDITIVEKKGADTRKICEIVETPLNQVSQSILSLTKVDAETRTGEEMDETHEPTKGDFAIETEEMKETIQIPFAEVVTLTHTSVQETALGTQDEIFERPLVQAGHQGTLSLSIVQDTEKVHSDIRNQEMYKTSEKDLVPVAQNVLSSSMADNIAINPSRSQALEAMTSSIQDGDKSQNLQFHRSKSLLVQARSIMSDNEENTGNKELHETIQRLLVQNVEDMLIPALSVQNIATKTHVSIDKPFFQATQNALDITIAEKKEESHDSDIHLSKNLFKQTITSTAADNKETVGTRETYESKRRFSVPYAQNVLSSTIVYNTGKSDDPEIILENLSSQATSSAIAENRAIIDQSPSTKPAADFCSSLKELDISVQLLPYLESGVKQHPQVLNWLNTKRRRVFASSYFSLFAEVTRILRITQKGQLTEDDRNYIRECCGVLQGVAFDESWISYVHGFIEACGDGEDLINKEVEEAEGEASNLKAQIESMKKELASMKESLALLCDKAQGSTIPSSSEVRRFCWRSTCKSIFIFITIYLLMCVLIYSVSNLPL